MHSPRGCAAVPTAGATANILDTRPQVPSRRDHGASATDCPALLAGGMRQAEMPPVRLQ